MSKELYFLRSSEQKIVVDMFKLAHPNKEDELLKYTEFYGLSSKDLGLYALVDLEIAGAIWLRKFEGDLAATISLAVPQKFSTLSIDSYMMDQFLLEASATFEELKVDVGANEELRNFYTTYGFSVKDDKNIMYKKLEKKEIVRPSDGYDPRKWMD